MKIRGTPQHYAETLHVFLDILVSCLDLVLTTLNDLDSTCDAFADKSPSNSAFSALVNDCKWDKDINGGLKVVTYYICHSSPIFGCYYWRYAAMWTDSGMLNSKLMRLGRSSEKIPCLNIASQISPTPQHPNDQVTRRLYLPSAFSVLQPILPSLEQ